ncbi:PadR family transcriptional regulator [Kineothrix sp. MB12-C1]|uniref:PadR family transcriptional regulator n=1 Tax=Kineothrix sp. MB12-C1 TaxID=3070215 RepID=UPI0027D24A06|nr:PadR family transcriptional regulator [Kineothrix sp. MB12-C1]WMC94086.1 PadR family transcriptional regulator [Kineothrix sp. MB12-C1]
MIYPISAPLLDFLILSIVRDRDSYGYQIGQQLKSVSSMKDSTLYPILRRLSENGFVVTYDQPFQGRNRKYYRITETGRKQWQFQYEEWQSHIAAIEEIINKENTFQEGGNDNE